MRIALVNCAVLPEPDIDEAPLLRALRDAGHDAQPLAWDDPAAEPGAFDACVLRATWNYHTQPEAFLAWVDHAATQTRLLNPAPTVRWNSHKRYLRHFEDRRIPIVPTIWATSSERADPIAQALARGWSKAVVKPCTSAGSRDTRVFDLNSQAAEARAFAADLRVREDAMVQRFLPSVADGGESALVCIAGQLSHAIRKYPRFADQDERVEAQPEITDAERRFAQTVLDACPHDHLYARVDIMRTDDGGIVLSELELIEPSLYFDLAPGSAERMARAIADAAGPVTD